MKMKTIVHFYVLAALVLGFAQLSLADLNDGLVAHYPFAGNATDATGNGNDCQVFGATLTAGYNGNNSAAYYFDGIDDYLNCLATSSLDISAALTVSAWINPAGVPDDWKAVVARWSGFQDQELFGLYINSILEVGGEITTRGGGLVRVFDQNVIVPSEWQHVAMVYDTNSHMFRLFRNGVLLYEWGGLFFGGTPEMPLVDTDLTIGVVKRDELWHHFRGSIDDVRIYNRALTNSEIAQLYQSNDGNEDGSCRQAVGVISNNLNIHVPFLEFQSASGPLSFWVDFDYYGVGPNGELLWKLKNIGQN